nr:pyoverdine biosynthesis protein PvcA [Pigmentibacter ruber]
MKNEDDKYFSLDCFICENILEKIYSIRKIPYKLTNTYENKLLLKKCMDFHLDKIKKFVQKSLPIEMIIPAFPVKSPNPNKTISCFPDYAEVLALKKLQHLCNSIKEIYPPGAIITICSDARVFCDIIPFIEDNISNYSSEIIKIIQTENLNNLSIFKLDNLFSHIDYAKMKSNFVKEFPDNVESLKRKRFYSPDFFVMFSGLNKFIYEDLVYIYQDKSKPWIRNEAKNLTFQIIQRSNTWSKLIEKNFPQALRLSIHPQSAIAKKIGVNLVDADDLWRTPWHSVCCWKDNQFFLTSKEHALALGAHLEKAEEKYPYYKL